jgi:hypothetical protein
MGLGDAIEKQRNKIICDASDPRVLVIDDPELSAREHQIRRVEVAMAENDRFRFKLGCKLPKFCG